jgi:putative transposase
MSSNPKLRKGSYFPEWPLEGRKRAESALITIVEDCYLAGVSTRRMDKLVKTLGLDALSKSQVSRMAAELDAIFEDFPHRPLGAAGPFTFLATVLLATRYQRRRASGSPWASGRDQRDRPRMDQFFADLVARGLCGVRLVTSDAHTGLRDAIVANLPGAAWQRCRTHCATNLMSVTPKSMWPAVTLLQSIYDQPDAAAVDDQLDRLLDYVTEKLPAVAEHFADAREDILAFTAFRKTSGPRFGRTTPPSGSAGRSAAAPMPWASSPTATRSSASSAPSSPNRPTHGPKAAATPDLTSSPAAASQSPTPTQR